MVESPLEKNLSTIPEDTQQKIKELLPSNTNKEIMSCDTKEAKFANNLILYFAKTIAEFSNHEMFNKGMQILQIALCKQALGQNITPDTIYQDLVTKYGEIPWDDFEKNFKILAMQNRFSPLEKVGGFYKLTNLGKFIITSFQKLKAELLIVSKGGELKDLYAMIENVRDFWDYDQYGQGIDWIFPLLYNLQCLTETLANGGEEILKDPDIDSQIKAIHDLIDQILEINRDPNALTMEPNINHSVQIAIGIIKALKELSKFAGQKLDYRKLRAANLYKESPFPKIEAYILENFETIDWQEWFEKCPGCATPKQYSLKINEYLLKKAILAFLNKKEELEYAPLPEKPSLEHSEILVDDLNVRKDDLIPLKEEIYANACKLAPSTEYEVIKGTDLPTLFTRLKLIYLLSFEKRLHFDADIIDVQDVLNQIKYFTAHKYEIVYPTHQSEKNGTFGGENENGTT